MNIKFSIIILGIIISGCVQASNSETIKNWNKIEEQEFQIEKVLTDNAAFQSKDINDWTNRQQNTIGKLETLIQEEDHLISDFAGSTANLEGDAKIYANDALVNIREVYKYRVEALENFKQMVIAKQKYDDKVYDDKKNQLDDAEHKVKEYHAKASDSIMKLKSLK